MKKFLCIISVLFLFACSGSSDKKSASRIIKGTAATGAYMPDGSPVELRSAPVATGNTIRVGSWVNPITNETMYDDEPETIPSAVLTGTVTGGNGKYTIDVSGISEPYLIRVQDTVSGKWYYSYADGLSDTANVNPYTDWMVRAYYIGYWDVDADDCFADGKMKVWGIGDNKGQDISYCKTSRGFDATVPFWYGRSMPLPDNAQIARTMAQLQYVTSSRYSIDIGDVLTRSWIVGESYDAILDTTTIDHAYMMRTLDDSYYTDDMMEKGIVYYYNSGTMIHVEIWSKYSSIRLMSLSESASRPDGYLEMSASEVVDGIYHYVYDGSITRTDTDLTVMANNHAYDGNHVGAGFGIPTFSK